MSPPRARFAQQHADVSGTWDLTVTGATDAYTFSMVAEIVQQDTALTGTLDGPSGKRDLTGTVDGNQVTFSITIESPESAFTLTFTGTLEDDQLSGTMSAGEGQYRAPWTARRREGGVTRAARRLEVE